jgi:hypothetical protein
VSALKSIARNINLLSPDEGEGHLAKARFSEVRKEKLVWDLVRFYEYNYDARDRTTDGGVLDRCVGVLDLFWRYLPLGED